MAKKKIQIQIFQKWWENGVLETSKLLENNTMPKVADTFVVSADPDLVDMGKGIIGRIRGHSRQDFRVQVACTMGDAARGPTILRGGVAPGRP